MSVEEELGKKLNQEYVAKRSQGGQNLSYIEAHHAIREANRIFGFGGWQRVTSDLTIVQQEEKPKGSGSGTNWYVGYTAKCEIHADVDGDDVIRIGMGFGQGIDSDLGRAHESAIKEAESDAMKRALMTFGDPFGLALYDKKQEHVEKPTAASQNGRQGTGWKIPVFLQILRDRGLKQSDLAIVLGAPLTADNWVGKVDGWLADNDTKTLQNLADEAAEKLKVTPADLTPTSDVRQPQMAGVN